MRKTPVIARRLGALTEIVAESGGGRLFSSDDELLQAIESLAGSRDERDRLGEQGYDAFVRRWSREAHMGRYYDLLEVTARRALGPRPLGRVSAVLIVTYHDIAESASAVTVTPRQLTNDLEALATAGFTWVSLDRCADWLAGTITLPPRIGHRHLRRRVCERRIGCAAGTATAACACDRLRRRGQDRRRQPVAGPVAFDRPRAAPGRRRPSRVDGGWRGARLPLAHASATDVTR